MKIYYNFLCFMLCVLSSTMTIAKPAKTTQKERSNKIVSPKADRGITPKITAPKEHEVAKNKALAFLKRVEGAIQSKSYDQVAPLISKMFVSLKPGEPVEKETIQFIDSLLCGMLPKATWRSKPHCVKLKNVEGFTLEELDFYDVGAWQVKYSLTGPSGEGSKTMTVSIDLSLTIEEVPGEGKVLRLMGPAG